MWQCNLSIATIYLHWQRIDCYCTALWYLQQSKIRRGIYSREYIKHMLWQFCFERPLEVCVKLSKAVHLSELIFWPLPTTVIHIWGLNNLTSCNFPWRGFFYHMKSFFNLKWQKGCHLQIETFFAISNWKSYFSLKRHFLNFTSIF